MENLNTYYDICETLSRELGEANDKIKNSGGKMTSGDLDYIDKLTHAIKSVKTTIAMIEAEDGGESGYMPHYNNGSYMHGGSYARGRDSRGRYVSRRGNMSYDDGMVEELRDLMNRAPDESTRRDIQKLVSKMERM